MEGMRARTMSADGAGPTMGPTTRSRRLSSDAQSHNSKGTAAHKSLSVGSALRKAEIVKKDESPLKLCGTQARASAAADMRAIPGKELKPKVRISAKKKKPNQGEQDEDAVKDMEDLCSPQEGSLSDPSFLETEVTEIRTSLLAWYDNNHRVLPWRINAHSCLEGVGEYEEKYEGDGVLMKNDASHHGASRKRSTPNPATDSEGERAYAVWVSEMMLQQTRVATVISYYQRWMETWPSVHDLAQASQEEVNSVWAGLGYYRRARFLLEGAKQIVQNLGGKFPRTVEELQKVPGIGSYTAGAIASIAFKEAVPVVDGNVIRVLCRLRAISLNPKASTTVKLFWALATQLVYKKRPGDFNQALMELGATICTPTSPSCASCPIASHCKALKLVSQLKQNVTSVTCFPTKVLKPSPREDYVAVCIVELEPEIKSTTEGSSLLLVQRPLQGLLAGLWEFPSAPLDNSNSTVKSRLTAMDKYLQKKLGIRFGAGGSSVMKRKEIGTYIHEFSHIRLHMFIEWLVLRRCEEAKGAYPAETQDGVMTKWVDLHSMGGLGLTSGVKKVYKMFSALREKQPVSSNVPKRKRSKS